MYLSGLTHRDELFNLTLRWLNDDFQPDDGLVLTRIFFYESLLASCCVIPEMLGLLENFYGPRIHVERIRQKHLLRKNLIRYLPYKTPRTDELVSAFEANPEFFFPRLPVDAVLVLSSDGRLVSLGRIKRLSRVAEKVSFRLIDTLFHQIKAEAEHFAEARATHAGLPFSGLISSPEAMRQDFIQAELAVAAHFRDKVMRLEPASLTINDMIGFKIVGEPEELNQVMERMKDTFSVIEIQTHSGNYNATNLTLDVALPPVEEVLKTLRQQDFSLAAQRGLDPAQAVRDLPDYLDAGSKVVRLEVILTTYPELLESEIGRSIHELRILRLRDRMVYSGLLAQNAGYLIEYLLSLAMAPVVRITELPIKLYGRYLPETIQSAKSALFQSGMDGSLLDAFCLH
jgi:hypothetical protein